MREKSFTLKNDQQVYTLRFDFNQICEAEPVVGVNLMSALIAGASATQARGLLYACLKSAHPAVMLSEAGDLLSRDMKTVTDALAAVIQAEPGDDEETEPHDPDGVIVVDPEPASAE